MPLAKAANLQFAGISVDRKTNLKVLGRQHRRRNLRPLDDAWSRTFEIFVQADSERFRSALDPPEIEMIQTGAGFGILVHIRERKTWARDAGVEAKSSNNSLRKAGFAGPERAPQQDQITRPK